ncbi:MAG TPA: hypothetical protein VND15_03600 [Candidatus Acidoferrales bacterium]|nr:hypothetical protein [Candidatus Acidoferrales bacterium]
MVTKGIMGDQDHIRKKLEESGKRLKENRGLLAKAFADSVAERYKGMITPSTVKFISHKVVGYFSELDKSLEPEKREMKDLAYQEFFDILVKENSNPSKLFYNAVMAELAHADPKQLAALIMKGRPTTI